VLSSLDTSHLRQVPIPERLLETMADRVYRATTTAPVNIAVVK